MCQSLFRLVFCEFNRLAMIISKSRIETLDSYSRSNNVNVNMPFPSSNIEGNYSTYVFCK